MGGGLVEYNASLNLVGATVTDNLALAGGPGGLGFGGGVYHFGGVYTADSDSVIQKNHSSTSGDNVAP